MRQKKAALPPCLAVFRKDRKERREESGANTATPREKKRERGEPLPACGPSSARMKSEKEKGGGGGDQRKKEGKAAFEPALYRVPASGKRGGKGETRDRRLL